MTTNLGDGEDGVGKPELNALKTRLLNCWDAVRHVFNVRRDKTKWRLLFVELFVAISLCVAYYFLVENFATGTQGKRMNMVVFSSCSIPGFHLQALKGSWQGRLSGLLLSGWLCDFAVKGDSLNVEQYECLFALYQSVWLFLLFLAVIFALRHSLFINLGIFAGLMYDFSPISGPYFFPWDMPAMLFFTLAVLLFERRQMLLMTVVICAGCFFKETVLVCALLALFASQWKWEKRILTFAGIVAVYVLGKKFLLSQLDLDASALSLGDATNLRGWLTPMIPLEDFVGNIKVLFTPTLNSVIFANAGTLAAVLVLGWRRRFLPYMTVILAYLAGLFLVPGEPPAITEVRVFMQILPLSLILLSEQLLEPAESVPVGGGSAGFTPAWVVRGTFPILVPMTLLLIALSTGVAAWRYYDIFESMQPEHWLQSELGQRIIKPEGDVSDLATENELLRRRYAEAELKLATISVVNQRFSDATNYYYRALELDTNSITTLNDLAWLLATAPDASLRNGSEAVRLAERACEQGQNNQYKTVSNQQEALLLGTLAASYAEAGRFDAAVVTAKKAREVALEQGQNEIAARNEQLLELYKSHRAYHQ